MTKLSSGVSRSGDRDRGRDLEDRLVREHDGSLGNGPHVSVEPQRAERIDVAIGEMKVLAEVGEILVREAKAVEEVQSQLEAGGDEEPSFRRQ